MRHHTGNGCIRRSGFSTANRDLGSVQGLYWRLSGDSAMTSSVCLEDAQEKLAELVDRAARGEEIVIEREGRAAAKLVPIPETEQVQPPRVFGQNLLGITYIAPDFDDPMSEEDLKEWGY